MDVTGAVALPRQMRDCRAMGDVLVLCYHAVSDAWPSELAVRPDDLRRQIARLLERGFEATTFSEAVLRAPARKTLAVTFDDGYASMHSHALPVLSELGVPATLFVPSGFVGTGQPMRWPGIDHWVGTEHERELRPLDWLQLGDLAEAGWEVGSHTVTHPRLTRLDEPALTRELRSSREEIERRLERRCATLAYPYGDLDERVVVAAADAGYATAAALPDRFPSRPRPLEWPRLMVGREDGDAAFARRTTRAFRVALASPAWPSAVRAWKSVVRFRD